MRGSSVRESDGRIEAMRKRYPSDVTDAQWELLRPLLPPARRRGRPRVVDLRDVLNTIFYQARAGVPWDYLPHDLVAKSTAWDYFVAWREDGTWQKILDAFRCAIRVAAGRDETPSAACIDTQSVKTTEVGGVSGDDGNNKVDGRKRHIVVDTLGLLIAVAVTAANLDGGTHASRVLEKLRAEDLPRLRVVFGDNKYNNRTLDKWMADRAVGYRVEVSSRPAEQKGFVPLKIRWVVERTFAWLGRCRRLSRDYEYTPSHSEAWVHVSAIQMMVRRLRPDPTRPQPEFRYPKQARKVA